MNLLISEIEKYMSEHQMSQTMLAKMADIDQSTLSRMLTGSSPKIATLEKIAKVMDRDVRELWCLVIDRPIVIPSPELLEMAEMLKSLGSERQREALSYLSFLKANQK